MRERPLHVQDLARRSVEVIREGQAPSGAYVACPTFEPYRFCWLRDGSFIADAMSRLGEVESAEAFHAWVARVVLAHRDRDRLEARYTLDGEDDPVEEWPKLQHDGWGLWLWAQREHSLRHGRRTEPYDEAARHVAGYILRVVHEPCTDWWEERVGIHAATLACLGAGLQTDELKAQALARADERVDGSLLVLPLLDIPAPHLVRRVEHQLVSPGGGVHRHPDDTYYGGGEWLLLTAMLGLAHLREDRRPEAEAALDWVAQRATEDGLLPEQAQNHLLSPSTWDSWVAKWGPPPCPLLWSHAMYLTLAHELGVVR
jgi:GH15 family glucan-1,4-alpha-glucosidase